MAHKTGSRAAPVGGWKPGQSGNPAGRKPGTGVLRLQKLEKQVGPERLAQIIEVVTAKALDGDMVAAGMLLNRLVPIYKASYAPIQISMPKGGSLRDRAEALIDAASTGDAPADVVCQMLQGLTNILRIDQHEDLIKRIEELEAGRGGKVIEARVVESDPAPAVTESPTEPTTEDTHEWLY